MSVDQSWSKTAAVRTHPHRACASIRGAAPPDRAHLLAHLRLAAPLCCSSLHLHRERRFTGFLSNHEVQTREDSRCYLHTHSPLSLSFTSSSSCLGNCFRLVRVVPTA